ncbi:MAG TPA: leucyl aminopeptidase [Planctomycetaceae bacterium]|nr:leucyl aminopeptidase [Planctomycetaceae bacterium]|tara:strand:- start:7328 stop:8815 length:1488 start_codon:yes stop_codon:yes gene_type:complete
MDISSTSGPLTTIEADWLIVGYTATDSSGELDAPLSDLDEALGGAVSRLVAAGDLTGKLSESHLLADVPGLAAGRLLLVGLGAPGKLTSRKLEKALVSATRRASKSAEVSAAIALPQLNSETISDTEAVSLAAVALQVGCVGQGLYRAKPGRHAFSAATVVSDVEGSAEAVARGSVLGQAMNLTRELVNRGAMEVYPETFADRATAAATECGLECEVLDENCLRDERMGSLMAVAQGSVRPPRVVVLRHNGGGEGAPALAIVGKGVTFDSGGLSLKSNEGMKSMKCDMAGAATMLGAMTAIAKLGLPVNVIGLAGLVENMPDGNSFKLGDVLTARNGKTIEVLNTDAEGRLVLADVLAYAVDLGAERLIDLATLTGACVVALGEEVTGTFSNCDDWSQAVGSAAKQAGELAWPMPMDDLFGDLLKSDVADIKNVGPRWGGAITAAKFLENFVDSTPWVHMDIAGPSFASSNKPHREGGATGCMVRTLVAAAEGLA